MNPLQYRDQYIFSRYLIPRLRQSKTRNLTQANSDTNAGLRAAKLPKTVVPTDLYGRCAEKKYDLQSADYTD
jgi:hypothetical protein